MQDKREIGYCTDRLEKVQYLKRVINTIIERVNKLKYLKFRESHNSRFPWREIGLVAERIFCDGTSGQITSKRSWKTPMLRTEERRT